MHGFCALSSLFCLYLATSVAGLLALQSAVCTLKTVLVTCGPMLALRGACALRSARGFFIAARGVERRRGAAERACRGVKSQTCFSRTTGAPLSEYGSWDDAVGAAGYVYEQSGPELYAYHCDVCSLYHLAPAARHTPSTECDHCSSSDGRPKMAYESRQDARRRADILREEHGADLTVYECPHGSGWHLSRRAERRRGGGYRRRGDRNRGRLPLDRERDKYEGDEYRSL